MWGGLVTLLMTIASFILLPQEFCAFTDSDAQPPVEDFSARAAAASATTGDSLPPPFVLDDQRLAAAQLQPFALR